MLDNVNAERIIATICASKLGRIEKAVHLHFRMICLQAADGKYAKFTRPFYTFYTILGNRNLDRVESERKERYRFSDLESVESVETQVDSHVLSRQARVGMCRR